LSPLELRRERPGDFDALDDLIGRAFAGHPQSDGSESRIVRELRAAGALTLSLVAIDDSRAVVGHVAFSPIVLSDATSAWYGLAPVSVEPARQRGGIGSALVREGLARLRALGAAGCVVLGDPAYYGRFGFALRSELVYPHGPADHFQALAFAGPFPRAEVTYHAAFDPPTPISDRPGTGSS
jgi:putative acetyltransferase